MTDKTTKPTLLDLIVDYLQRWPADLGNVASHFGMLPLDAQSALDTLERQGKARRGRYFLWESRMTDQSQTTIGAGLQRAMRDALIDVSGVKVTDADALEVIIRLRKSGAEVVYTSQVEQWGEMADCCIYRETGKQCSFCKCDRRNMVA